MNTESLLDSIHISVSSGELGKDVDFVAALDSEGVTNPSEHLLKEWSMEGGVTVADLLEVLQKPCL